MYIVPSEYCCISLMDLNILQKFTHYGTISVDGDDGSSGNSVSGGGSGGTITVTAEDLVGRGSFTSHGGSGSAGTYSTTYIG